MANTTLTTGPKTTRSLTTATESAGNLTTVQSCLSRLREPTSSDSSHSHIVDGQDPPPVDIVNILSSCWLQCFNTAMPYFHPPLTQNCLHPSPLAKVTTPPLPPRVWDTGASGSVIRGEWRLCNRQDAKHHHNTAPTPWDHRVRIFTISLR